MEPFTVQLSGIGQFEKTVFIDVANKNHLIQIITELSQSAKPLLYQPQFHKTPHISIAREMTPDQYQLAWPDWQTQEIKASFEVREVTLL